MRIISTKLIIIAFICVFTGVNAQTASQFLLKANKGDASAQMFLGLCYQEGRGVEKNDSIAVVWFEKASHNGLAEAQVMLGNCYREGRGVEKDSVKAYEWYDQASWCGASLGLDALGDAYYYGIGVQRDVIRARYYYSKAADKGYKKSKLKYDKIRYAKDEDEIIEL